jgi:predicted methyltransferase
MGCPSSGKSVTLSRLFCESRSVLFHSWLEEDCGRSALNDTALLVKEANSMLRSMMGASLMTLALVGLGACDQLKAGFKAGSQGAEDAGTQTEQAAGEQTQTTSAVSVDTAYAQAKMEAVIADPRRDEDRARDAWRNPKETLEFFGIEPNMTVVEALPGGGWYTRVLLPYVHNDGSYIAMNYPMPVFEKLFGDGLTDERRAELALWEETFIAQGPDFGPEDAVIDGAIRFSEVPDEMAGAADAVVYIRALHNLARFGMLNTAAQDAFKLLKSGGVVGVVQHRAKTDAAADYVDGSKGYLKEADVIAAFEAAGFEFEESSEINANPNDPADHEIGVWAMPPRGAGGEATAELGESDRMTLRFRKP